MYDDALKTNIHDQIAAGIQTKQNHSADGNSTVKRNCTPKN